MRTHRHLRLTLQKYGLELIEDNAQTHDCMFQEQHTGSIGNAAGRSFYPGKNLGAFGDGGAVTINDNALADDIRSFGNYDREKKSVLKYTRRNSLLEEKQAAILCVKINTLHR